MKIPKKIREEIQSKLLDHLGNDRGMLISHPTFKYCSELIKMRYLKFDRAGNKFTRRLSFEFKRILSLDPFPKKNQEFWDEVIKIHVILEGGKSFTSSSYPNKEPNFKLPESVKIGVNSIILNYLRSDYRIDKVLISPVFKYEKNIIQVSFINENSEEVEKQFKFLKINQKVSKPTHHLERIIKIHTGLYGYLNTVYAYHN
jgi:hypothetical protein